MGGFMSLLKYFELVALHEQTSLQDIPDMMGK